MKKVYIAASSEECDRASRFANACEDLGLLVVGKWWESVALARAEGRSDADLSHRESQLFARDNLAAIEDADAFVWLLGPKSEGAAFEFCHAIHLPRPIERPMGFFVVGSRRSIYTALEWDVHVPDETIALAVLSLMQKDKL